MIDEFAVRRPGETDYQLEDPDRTVLVLAAYEESPDIPAGMADDIVDYAFSQANSFDGTPMRLLVKMQLLGFRHSDDP